MKTSQLISFLLILSVWTISCFPSKPLNERSTELTWQAWLLIDESQNKQQQDSTLRRRITPKSVFIAPTFNPDSLPECSEGYQSDNMGRCIKIIMLNKELHLDFLLQQLNQKFGGMEDYEDEEITTTGPLNINIPLNGEMQEETDVAIVVAPTNNLLQNESEKKNQFNEEKVNVSDIAGILGLKQAEEVETTTITNLSTINTESTTNNYETTTIPVTTSEFNALFFLDPKRQIEVKTDTTTTTPSIESTETMRTTTELYEQSSDFITQEIGTDLPLLQMDQALPYSDTMFVPFSDTKRDVSKSVSDIETTETTTSMTTTFTPKPTTAMPEYKFNKLHQDTPTNEEKIEETQSTIGSTPDDNSLNLSTEDPLTSPTTSSLFSKLFHKPNYNNLNNGNTLKMFDTTRLVDNGPKLASSISTTTEMSSIISTQEIPTSTTDLRFPQATQQFVKFPTEETSTTENDYTLNPSKQFEELFNQYIHTRGTELNGKNIFNNYQLTTASNPFNFSQTLYQRYKAHRENHRNRDKNTEWFHLPTKWSDTSQKPVVLRFSRKHGYIDSQQLGSNNFYREINPRMFGFPKSRVQR